MWRWRHPADAIRSLPQDRGFALLYAAVIIKLPAYQRIASLQEILYLETERVGATVYRRAGEEWRREQLSRPEDRLQLQTIHLDVTLARLYRGIPGLSP